MKELDRIDLYNNDLAGWNFAGQNLANASFNYATLTDADLTDAVVNGTSFRDTIADLRRNNCTPLPATK